MINKYLHIVCLDVPYPPDYGGVYDLFYKIKAMHRLGIQIHLHCFEYGRGQQPELDKYCCSVNYYRRNDPAGSFSFRFPYIVSSRARKSLLRNLLRDDYPVLLEGIHCTYFLFTGDLKNKKVTVRYHNVEYAYYKELARATRNIFKKIYFNWESSLLGRYEKRLAGKAMLIAVSEKDKATCQKIPGAKSVEYLPVFVPWEEVRSVPGTGSFCLYHGNLSVPENEKAALWLMKSVFASQDTPLVIAGKNPSGHLVKAAHSNDNFCIVANPSGKEMDDLIKKAQVHILPSFNTTGIKIKVLNALFNGRFVLTNKAAVEDSGLEPLCVIAEEPADFQKIARELFQTPFTEDEISKRQEILCTRFNNEANARQLIKWIC